MENFARLMRRLLEIQSGGEDKSSPEPIVEDERLIESLQRRHLAGKPPQMVQLSQNSPEGTRFKV